MNKLRLFPVLAFALLVVLVSSCKKDKDPENGGTGNTDFQVYTLGSGLAPIEGATVNVYVTKEARDAGSNVFQTGVTGGQGFAFFSDIPPSTYYVSATKDFGNGIVKTGKADTGIDIKGKAQTAVTIVFE